MKIRLYGTIVYIALLSSSSALFDLNERRVRSTDRLSFEPPRRSYEFNQTSDIFHCAYDTDTESTENSIEVDDASKPNQAKLVVRNQLVGLEIASQPVHPVHGAHIDFSVRQIQTSTTFYCELYEYGRIVARKAAQVFVFTYPEIRCTTNKDCWGYGRNVVCDSEHTQRCMCASKTARTAASPICIEVIPEEKCDHMICDGSDDDCVCQIDPAIVLKSRKYIHRSPDLKIFSNDQIVLFNGTSDIDELYIDTRRDECKRCLRNSNNLQNLQVGLFLVGVVLAFTAVILMAVVIRKMWHHYRIPADLLEASRDLERETIEREAEQMAQRDKPPTYVEVMEYDLQISGYPPPDYEDLATAVRHHAERRRNPRRHRRTQNLPPINTLVTIQPAVMVRRPIFTTVPTVSGHSQELDLQETNGDPSLQPPPYEDTRQRY